MTVPEPAADDAAVLDAALDAVLLASRTLVAISAQSIASGLDEVDVMQFRILVVAASQGPCSLGGIAEAVGLHVSTASRACDRLTAVGLLNRSAAANDRRDLELLLTPAGAQRPPRRRTGAHPGRRRAGRERAAASPRGAAAGPGEARPAAEQTPHD